MIKALRLMSYANRPSCTPILQGDRRVRKGNRTIKVIENQGHRVQKQEVKMEGDMQTRFL